MCVREKSSSDIGMHAYVSLYVCVCVCVYIQLAIALRESLANSNSNAADGNKENEAPGKEMSAGKPMNPDTGAAAGGVPVGPAAAAAAAAGAAATSGGGGAAERGGKSSRMLKELATLAPWGWDARVTVHPPGAKSLRDFSQVAADVDFYRERGGGGGGANDGMQQQQPQQQRGARNAAAAAKTKETSTTDANAAGGGSASVAAAGSIGGTNGAEDDVGRVLRRSRSTGINSGPTSAAVAPTAAEKPTKKKQTKQSTRGAGNGAAEGNVPSTPAIPTAAGVAPTTDAPPSEGWKKKRHRSSMKRVSAFTPGRVQSDETPERKMSTPGSARHAATPTTQATEKAVETATAEKRRRTQFETPTPTQPLQNKSGANRASSAARDAILSPRRKRKNASRAPASVAGDTPERRLLDFASPPRGKATPKTATKQQQHRASKQKPQEDEYDTSNKENVPPTNVAGLAVSPVTPAIPRDMPAAIATAQRGPLAKDACAKRDTRGGLLQFGRILTMGFEALRDMDWRRRMQKS